MNVSYSMATKNGMKVVGKSEGKVFKKTVKWSKHYFKKFSGWAIDYDLLLDLDKSGIEVIEIKDTEYKNLYTAPLKTFLEKGTEIDFGHGIQIVLNKQYFSVVPF